VSDHASAGRTARMSRGACLHADPELFFPAATGVTGAGQAPARVLASAGSPAAGLLPRGRVTWELADGLPARVLLDRAAGAALLVLGATRPAGDPAAALGPVPGWDSTLAGQQTTIAVTAGTMCHRQASMTTGFRATACHQRGRASSRDAAAPPGPGRPAARIVNMPVMPVPSGTATPRLRASRGRSTGHG